MFSRKVQDEVLKVENIGGFVQMSVIITVRRSSDNASCDVNIADGTVVTVKDLISKCKAGLEIPSGHFIRLITKGKLMTPDGAKLDQFNLENGSVLHCVVTTTAPNGANANPSSSSSTPSLPRGGLSELTTHGLEVDEVVALRLTFSEEIERFRRSRRLDMRPGESENQFTSRVESQWLLSQRNSSFLRNLSPGLNRYGSAVRAQIANLQRERLVGSGSRDENDDHSDDSEDEWDDLNDEAPPDTLAAQIRSMFSSQPAYQRLREQEMASLREREGATAARNRAARRAEGDEGSDNEYDEELAMGNSTDADRSATGGMRMNRSPIPTEDQMGTTKDYCWGVMLGTAFGTLMLLCIFDRNMNHKNKMGILLGVSMQLLFSIANNRTMAEHIHEQSSGGGESGGG